MFFVFCRRRRGCLSSLITAEVKARKSDWRLYMANDRIQKTENPQQIVQHATQEYRFGTFAYMPIQMH